MVVLDFLKEYWVIITFFVGEVAILCGLVKSFKDAILCSLRNDILGIYDRCKDRRKITRYQLQSISFSYSLYKKFGGNSFVDEIVEIVRQFELID